MRKKTIAWRLNNRIVKKKKKFNDYIKEKKNTLLQVTMKIQQYKILWDATKAILRRKLKWYMSSLRSKKNFKQSNLPPKIITKRREKKKKTHNL